MIQLGKHGISSIFETIRNCNWDTLITSVQELCEFEPTSNTFGIPSLACKVGQSLKSIADEIIFQKLKSGDKEGGEIAETFLKLYDLGWTKDISAKAIRTLQMKKCNKRRILPLVEDVVKITKYIDRRFKELEHVEHCYKEYCQLVLAQIIFFSTAKVEGKTNE